jgi:hypothetical protein
MAEPQNVCVLEMLLKNRRHLFRPFENLNTVFCGSVDCVRIVNFKNYLKRSQISYVSRVCSVRPLVLYTQFVHSP